MKLKCTDLIGGDCPFIAEGAAQEDVIKSMMEHGDSVHADLMAGKSPQEAEAAVQAMTEKMKASITE